MSVPKRWLFLCQCCTCICTCRYIIIVRTWAGIFVSLHGLVVFSYCSSDSTALLAIMVCHKSALGKPYSEILN